MQVKPRGAFPPTLASIVRESDGLVWLGCGAKLPSVTTTLTWTPFGTLWLLTFLPLISELRRSLALQPLPIKPL